MRGMGRTQAAQGQRSPDAATRLAVERTRLAYERTLMAWVRTSASLITFGFTIYKFFEFERTGGTMQPVRGAFSPRTFALLMIAIGLMTLVMAAVQHRQSLAAMRAEYGDAPAISTAGLTAMLFTLLGVVALVVVLLRR